MKEEGRSPNSEAPPARRHACPQQARKAHEPGKGFDAGQHSALVCFAFKAEAKPFIAWAKGRRDVEVLVTGMGKRNAERTIRLALAKQRFDLVLTCGFAGGLRPELEPGAVLFAAEGAPGLESALEAAGARRARFHCADRIASTAQEKRGLWESTGADAVEMESQVICALCVEQRIPSAVVRVVLDAAREDLPLDFNRLTTPDQTLDYGKLAKALLKRPGRIGALRRLQAQSQAAAQRLAAVLEQIFKMMRPARPASS